MADNLENLEEENKKKQQIIEEENAKKKLPGKIVSVEIKDVRDNIILGVKPLQTSEGYAAERAKIQAASLEDPAAKDRILKSFDQAAELSARVGKGSRDEQLKTFNDILKQINELADAAVKNAPKNNNGAPIGGPGNDAQHLILHDLRNMASMQANAFDNLAIIKQAEDARYNVINNALAKLAPMSSNANRDYDARLGAAGDVKIAANKNPITNYDPDVHTAYAMAINQKNAMQVMKKFCSDLSNKGNKFSAVDAGNNVRVSRNGKESFSYNKTKGEFSCDSNPKNMEAMIKAAHKASPGRELTIAITNPNDKKNVKDVCAKLGISSIQINVLTEKPANKAKKAPGPKPKNKKEKEKEKEKEKNESDKSDYKAPRPSGPK